MNQIKINIDSDTVQIGKYVYSIKLLAGGILTPPEVLYSIVERPHAGDGPIEIEVRAFDMRPLLDIADILRPADRYGS